MILPDFSMTMSDNRRAQEQVIFSASVRETVSGTIGPAIRLVDADVIVKCLPRVEPGRRTKVFVIVPDFNIERDLSIMQLVGQLRADFDFDIVPTEVANMIPADACDV